MKAIIILLAVLFSGQTMACEHDKAHHKEHKHPCAEHEQKHEKKADESVKTPAADSKAESAVAPAGKSSTFQ